MLASGQHFDGTYHYRDEVSRLTVTIEPEAASDVAPKPVRSFPAGLGLLAIVAVLVMCLFFGVKFSSSQGANPSNPQAAADTQTTVKNTPADSPKELALPAKDVPLRPPPNDAKVVGKEGSWTATWTGKELGYASIIVDYGRRMTDLPRRGWEIAVITAMQESRLKNEGSKKYPVTGQFPYDSMGDDYDSVGLFQQRPSQGWGDPEQLMDPRYATKKFYDKLAAKVKNWKDWLDPSKVQAADIAQAVQVSKYPDAYRKHEQNAIKIVDLVLQYQYTPEYYKTNTQNNWFVMVQCQDPKARACRSMPWSIIQPIADNFAAFKAAFPKAELNAHLGDWRHENVAEPLDHSPIGQSCVGKACNRLGWVYAQDFGNGKATDTGFGLDHFAHWIIDECRAKSKNCEGIKYIITTIPSNKGTKYYGVISVRTGWAAEPHDPDHDDHIHLSWQPGFERAHSAMMANYVAYVTGGGSR